MIADDVPPQLLVSVHLHRPGSDSPGRVRSVRVQPVPRNIRNASHQALRVPPPDLPGPGPPRRYRQRGRRRWEGPRLERHHPRQPQLPSVILGVTLDRMRNKFVLFEQSGKMLK